MDWFLPTAMLILGFVAGRVSKRRTGTPPRPSHYEWDSDPLWRHE